MNNENKRKISIAAAVSAIVLLLLIAGCAIYLFDYYRADMQEIEAFTQDLDVKKSTLPDGAITYGSSGAEIGFIFYPGGKVEHTAYEPLMAQLAEDGIFCVLTEMPFHLAVLDMNAADDIFALYPEIERWYIGGHSLGGAMAACYAAENVDRLEGLVLLGAYSSEDLTATDLRVISLYGSEDKVMNREKYDEYRGNLPADLTETVIAGGCHAYFGMYGEQEGDGAPAICAEEQITLTAEYITQWITEGDQ